MNQETNEERELKVGEEAGPALGPEERLEALTAYLEEAGREREQLTNALQRAQADFVNYRRRVEDEREDQLKYSNGRLLSKLLPVLDEFNLAIGQAPGSKTPEPWLKGVNLIYRKLHSIIESEGVAPIEAEGKSFNPVEHEALAQQESSEHEEGWVMAVVRDGYKLYERVLRPAQVIVAKRSECSIQTIGEGESSSEGKED